MFGVYIKPRAQEFIFCLVFVAQEAILCIVRVILNPSSYSLKINNPSLFVNTDPLIHANGSATLLLQLGGKRKCMPPLETRTDSTG